MRTGIDYTTPNLGVLTVPEMTLLGRSVILDITSYLLASHFGFLAAIESAFRPVGVSTTLISALHLIQDQLSAGTSDSPEQRNRLLQLVARGDIRIIGDSRQPMAPPAPGRAFRVTCPTASSDSCAISLDELLLLVARPAHASIRLPRPGDLIVCPTAALSALARHNCLESAASQFTLAVEETELELVSAEMESESERHRLSSWLGDQIEHIRGGLISGVYALHSLALPVTPSPLFPAFVSSVVETCQDRTALMWVDARCTAARYSSAQGPIIDVSQILAYLHDAGYLNENHLHETLFRMRDADVLCLPVTPAEVLFCLRRARLQDGALVEAGPLSTLRQNLAKSVASTHGAEYKEFARDYADSLLGVIEDAIVQCWAEAGASEHVAAVWADWLLNGVYWDALAALQPGRETRRLVAGFAAMISRAYRHWPGTGTPASRRECCISWIGSRFCALTPSATVRSALSDRILELPPPIRDQVLINPSIRAGLGLSVLSFQHSMDPVQ